MQHEALSVTQVSEGSRGILAQHEAHAFTGGSGSLLTVSEVASVMRVSNMTVYRLIKRGDLAAVRVGHGYRIRRAEVERYLSERSVRVQTEER